MGTTPQNKKGKTTEEKRNNFLKFYFSLPKRKRVYVDYILDTKRKQKHKLHMVSPSP